MNSNLKKALLSMLIVAAPVAVNCAEEAFVPTPISTDVVAKGAGVLFDEAAAAKLAALDSQTFAKAGEVNSLPGVADLELPVVAEPEMVTDLVPGLNSISLTSPSFVPVVPAALTRVQRLKYAFGRAKDSVIQTAGNAVSAVRATRPVQFVETTVTTYPRASKAVAGVAVVAGLYAAANSQYGKQVRAKVESSNAYKSAAKFVKANQETLKKVAVGAVALTAAVVGGKKVVLPRVTQWLAQAAC